MFRCIKDKRDVRWIRDQRTVKVRFIKDKRDVRRESQIVNSKFMRLDINLNSKVALNNIGDKKILNKNVDNKYINL